MNNDSVHSIFEQVDSKLKSHGVSVGLASGSMDKARLASLWTAEIELDRWFAGN